MCTDADALIGPAALCLSSPLTPWPARPCDYCDCIAAHPMRLAIHQQRHLTAMHSARLSPTPICAFPAQQSTPRRTMRCT